MCSNLKKQHIIGYNIVVVVIVVVVVVATAAAAAAVVVVCKICPDRAQNLTRVFKDLHKRKMSCTNFMWGLG